MRKQSQALQNVNLLKTNLLELDIHQAQQSFILKKGETEDRLEPGTHSTMNGVLHVYV